MSFREFAIGVDPAALMPTGVVPLTKAGREFGADPMAPSTYPRMSPVETS